MKRRTLGFGRVAFGIGCCGSLLVAGCGGDDDGEPSASGGAATGGASWTGGASTGGFATGGASSGGAWTGGAVTGGAVTGGAATGGAVTGGAVTGGAATGGVATGGAVTGGAVTGGVATGGAVTGGTVTGGTVTGGVATGGVATGGAATGGTATGGIATGGTPTGGTPSDCIAAPALAVELLTTTAIAELGTPFDPLDQDETGPYDWGHKYGKTPEIVPFVQNGAIDLLYQAQDSSTEAYVVHVEGSGTSFAVTRAYRVGSLGRIMGFTRDDFGNYYVATGVDEDDLITVSYPPDGIHRSDIVRIVKFDATGCVTMESDVDVERGIADDGSELMINPMVAATSRLAWGGGRLALVHGNNTEPDSAGVRHQKALATHIDDTTGAVTRVSTMWASHSFDQRLAWNGQAFVEMHLGDAYDRSVSFGSYSDAGGRGGYNLFFPKGALGDNATYTQLGSFAPIASGTWGYLVAFATDRSPNLPASGSNPVGALDLALLRVSRDFAAQQTSATVIDTAFGEAQVVTSSGETQTNHVLFLTDYGAQGAGIHVNRPRVVAIGGDHFVVVWDRWEGTGNASQYVATWGAVVDADGAVVQAATQLGTPAIARGDDAVALGDRALWVTGDGSGRRLLLNLVDGSLGYVQVALN